MNHNLLKYLCAFCLLYLVVIPFVPPAAADCTECFFKDDFNRESLGSNWTLHTISGVHSIINNGVLELSPSSIYHSVDARYAYTAKSYTTDFVMEVSAKGQANAEFVIGVTDVSSYDSVQDAPHHIAFRRSPSNDNNRIYLVYANGGGAITLWNSSAGQFDSVSAFVNFKIARSGNNYTAYINGVEVYNEALSIDFVDGSYQFSFDFSAISSSYFVTYIDYFYTFCAPLNLSVQTTIDIFVQNNIDNATISLTSQILKMFISAAEAALKVGSIIIENFIDTITTVIKIGQSVLTVIAQASTSIYSGLITIISQVFTYINSGIMAIIDNLTVIINSFNAIIDSIITSFETYFDEDTAYGAIIRVIPLLLLLSVPTIVVYYRIGEFATIPMFMFMSIVAYATSLMPLWILIVALIGCIAILLQKRAKT